MMLMTKFGKFKLRLIATINLSALLAVFNIASTTSNYWIKYLDHFTGESHFAGMWRSCPSNQGPCVWKSGIINHQHTFWSWLVRVLITVGTAANLLVIIFYIMAFFYKMNKKSRCAIWLMEWANIIAVAAFCTLMLGFCAFIANTCNYSIWLHVICMILIIISSNWTTRCFATLYFQNTRGDRLVMQCSKSCEAAMSTGKLCGTAEEKIALTPITQDAITNTEAAVMHKSSETTGSNAVTITVTTQTPALVECTATNTATDLINVA